MKKGLRIILLAYTLIILCSTGVIAVQEAGNEKFKAYYPEEINVFESFPVKVVFLDREIANEYIIYAINDPEVKPGKATFNWQGHKEMHNTIITGALQGKERLRDKNGKTTHPTQKPLSILKKLIQIEKERNEIIVTLK